MSGLRIIQGNRLERLGDRLAEIVRDLPASAMEPEIIVVQSRGMQRWIAMALARRNGISANLQFPFPNRFLEDLHRRLKPDLPDASPFAPEVLTFRIMKLLPVMLDRPAFSSLKRYLADDERGFKRYQLARRLADLYDQYLVFRPEMVFNWESGKDGDTPESRWQAELWRALVDGCRQPHRARMQLDLLQRIEARDVDPELLPKRLSLFGISYLPPFHLRTFGMLARLIPVTLFFLNPCSEYWSDVLDEKEMHRLAPASGSAVYSETLHMDSGHPLLASMGGLGRDFLYLISEQEAHFEDCFEEISGQTLLSSVQADILHLRKATCDLRAAIGGFADRSIQVHACHSPMREIEVLHDRLLEMFENVPQLEPRHVVVMAPDIGSYAPYIEAVFGSRLNERHRIPFSIADQSARQESRLIESFFSLLAMPRSRFGATRVLGLLEEGAVRRRFGLRAADLEIIERWVCDLNIRWARDAQERAGDGLPATRENTWEFGIERLLLGYALPGGEKRLFAGILPYDMVEGSDARVLGRFLEYLAQLFEAVEELEISRTPLAWQRLLIDFLERFFEAGEETERDLQFLRNLLDDFGRLETQAETDETVDVALVRGFLADRLDRAGSPGGFITGGVTFCAMLPMRSIPFKIVCLVGMNNEAFPRDQRPVAFDLMARFPRAGDRSRRRDDRYLFLESLVSARERFYISYVGQSIQDNSVLPPSVLVSELLEVLDRHYGIAAERLVVRHPLQAFSRRYFNGESSELFTYFRENLAAARQAESMQTSAPFFIRDLSESAEDDRTLPIEHLCRFFVHPARWLLQQRLQLQLKEPRALPEDKENFRLDPLTRHRLRQEMVEAGLGGLAPEATFPIQKAKGDLPQENVGRFLHEQLAQEVETFMRKLDSVNEERRTEARDVELAVAGYRLTGRIDGLFSRGRLQARFARLKAKDLLTAWIWHLVLCCPATFEFPRETFVVNLQDVRLMAKVEDPRPRLADLLHLYEEGRRRPLPFFPDLSLVYCERLRSGRTDERAALESVRRQWRGSDFRPGASEDPYHRLGFSGTDPIDKHFQRTAQTVFLPLLDHLEKLP
jgi:exodeoxyribonuclease V gamma subunit